MNAIDTKVLLVIPFIIDTVNGSYVCSKGLAIDWNVSFPNVLASTVGHDS